MHILLFSPLMRGICVDFPNGDALCVDHLVLDLNGTVSVAGRLLPGVKERIEQLQALGFTIYLLTADTRGKGAEIATSLGVQMQRVVVTEEIPTEACSKRAFIESVGPQRCVAMGNGRNDEEMMRAARLGIAVLGEEGLAVGALLAADVVVSSPTHGLDLLLFPQRLLATLRT